MTYKILRMHAMHENGYIEDFSISDVQIGAEIFLAGCDAWYHDIGRLIPEIPQQKLVQTPHKLHREQEDFE